MRVRTTTAAALAVLALALTACSSEDGNEQADTKPSAAVSPASSTAPDDRPADARRYDSAKDIADALAEAGLTTSEPQEETGENYIAKVGGTAYTFTVTDQDGQAPGSAGINMFPNPEALKAWVPLSEQFGGIAVTGDTWAVSLPTTSEAERADSERLAPVVAKALNGTVQQ
ncbi:hypothetical protein ABZ669_14595 [Streptomyces hirsutus]|uniref:hypothetical protein n=1 Tax=Streptomyces hirsutus TaxID=35620 RepID=UPI0033D33CB0